MKRKSQRRTAAAVASALLAAGLVTGSAYAAKTVRTVGGPEFEPNQFIRDTVRFSPSALLVRPGERVTWVDRDRSPDPHTVTVVNRRNVPNTLGELFECRICGIALGHLEDPENPESGIRTVRLNRGRPGVNVQGDSLFLRPGGSISGRVTARVGSTLHYLCGIHPWMQGSIRVTRTGQPGPGGAGLTGRHH